MFHTIWKTCQINWFWDDEMASWIWHCEYYSKSSSINDACKVFPCQQSIYCLCSAPVCSPWVHYSEQSTIFTPINTPSLTIAQRLHYSIFTKMSTLFILYFDRKFTQMLPKPRSWGAIISNLNWKRCRAITGQQKKTYRVCLSTRIRIAMFIKVKFWDSTWLRWFNVGTFCVTHDCMVKHHINCTLFILNSVQYNYCTRWHFNMCRKKIIIRKCVEIQTLQMFVITNLTKCSAILWTVKIYMRKYWRIQ